MNNYLILFFSSSGAHKEYKDFPNIKAAKEYAAKEKIAKEYIRTSVAYNGRSRKTRDVYELHVCYGYGHGWEFECGADTRKEIKEHKREYAENCPEYKTKIVKKREKIEQTSTKED